MATPYEYLRLASTASTQDEARARLGDVPVLVVADRQHSGRGRGGRRWEAADRALFASLGIRPSWPRENWSLIPLAAGLAARAALGGTVGLKWPNDLMTGAGKVGGLLSEADGASVIVGLGVNLWWPDPAPGAAAIYDADPGADAAAALGSAWADELLALLSGPARCWGLERYKSACITLGSRVTWTGAPPPGTGTALDVDADGSLVVESVAGVVRLHSGEVHLEGRLR